MGDDITIGVTEIVNNIEVTAQPNDQVIDISVVDNSDEVTLNVTPNVVEVNINKGSSFARWGTLYGNILDQTDLQNALFNKADLVNGLVPAYQLPSFVDDVIEVANFAALPTTGETGKLYLTLDNNKIYRWGGSTYVEIASNQAIWGQITGTLSNQTDLQNALNAKQNLLNGTGFVKAVGTTISYDNTSYLPLTGGTLTGTTNFDGSGGTTSPIVSIFNNGQNRFLTPVLRLYGSTNISSNYVELRGENATQNRTIQFPDASGTVLLAGGTNNYIPKFTSSGSLANSNIFEENGSVGINNTNPSIFQSFANQLVIGNGSTSVGMTIFSGGVNNQGSIYFADSTSGDDRRRGAITYNHLLNLMNLDTNGVSRIRISEFGAVTINPGTMALNQGGTLNVSNGGQQGFEFWPEYQFGRSGMLVYNRATSAWNGVVYGALEHIFTTNATERMRITSGGNVGIGTNPLWSLSNNISLEIGSTQLLWSPTNGAANCGMANNLYRNSTTWIHKNTGAGGLIAMEGGEVAIYLASSNSAGSPSGDLGEKFRIFQNANVRIQSLGTGTVFSNAGTLTNTNPSDERLKENIVELKYGLNEILKLRPVTYLWKNDKINQGKQFGFIAQEVQEVMPELISEFTITEDEEEVVRLGLDKEGIYAALVNAIKELKEEIELLKQK